MVERLAFRAVDKTLQHNRAVSNTGQRSGRDGQVVLHDVQLRQADLFREIELVRVSDTNLLPVNREYLGRPFLIHANRLHRSRRRRAAALRLERDIQARDNAASRSNRISREEPAEVQNIQPVVQIVAIHLKARVDLFAPVNI